MTHPWLWCAPAPLRCAPLAHTPLCHVAPRCSRTRSHPPPPPSASQLASPLASIVDTAGGLHYLSPTTPVIKTFEELISQLGLDFDPNNFQYGLLAYVLCVAQYKMRLVQKKDLVCAADTPHTSHGTPHTPHTLTPAHTARASTLAGASTRTPRASTLGACTQTQTQTHRSVLALAQVPNARAKLRFPSTRPPSSGLRTKPPAFLIS